MGEAFADIVDIQAVQEVSDSLWRASKVPCAILDVDGTILIGSGWQRICTGFHRQHAETARLCRESDTFIQQQLKEEATLPACGYVEYLCKNGLTDIALPIMVEKRHLATLFVGQFFYEPPDRERFRHQAQRYGFDEQEYLAALQQVPILPRGRIAEVLEYSRGLTRMLTRLAEQELVRRRAAQDAERALRSKEKKLIYRERFERLLAGISTRFVKMGSADTDRAIAGALRRLGEFIDADRAELFQIRDGGASGACTHEWCAPGIASQQDLTPQLEEKTFPWSVEKVLRGEVLRIADLASLPPEAAVDRQSWERFGLKALIVVPIVVHGAVAASLGISAVVEKKAWQEKDLVLLKTVGEIIGNALERQGIEERLRESEARFRSIFETAAAGICTLSPDGRLLQVNRAFCQQFGYAEEELVGQRIEDLTFEAEREVTRQNYAKILAGEAWGFDYEKRYLRKDGTLLWGLTSVACVPGRDGRPAYCVGLVQDITARKRAEQALLESEQRLKDILNSSPAVVLLKDLDGRYRFVNQHFQDLFRLTQQEIVGKTDYDFFAADDARQYLEHDQQALQAGAPLPFEERIWLPDGWHTFLMAKFPLRDLEGRIYALCGFGTDITDRKRAEETLEGALTEAERARDRTDAILKSVPDGLLVTNMDQRVQLLNRPAEKILGVTLGQALWRPLSDLGIDVVLRQQIDAVLEGGGAEGRVDLHFIDPQGQLPQIIQAQTTLARGARGRKIGTITLLRDVTRERELDRMKNELISTAAHELRTPLTSVLGFSEVLLDPEAFGMADREQERELLQLIHTKAGALKAIIDDLLDLSRIQAGQIMVLRRSRFDLADQLREALAPYLMRKNHHRFELFLPDVPCPVEADRQKLTQVLENLLSNAVKFSPAGGRVRVTLRIEGERALTVVEDQGIGMTPLQMERVFDKFYRADASDTAVGGLGLGMSISRDIIRAHGGEIEVASVLQQGTTFTFWLPLVAATPEP